MFCFVFQVERKTIMTKAKPLSLDKLQGEQYQAQSLANPKCNNIFTTKLRKKDVSRLSDNDHIIQTIQLTIIFHSKDREIKHLKVLRKRERVFLMIF